VTRALVEGFAGDAIAVARLLARQGHQVRMAGPGRGPSGFERVELEALGIALEPFTDLDHDDDLPDVAFLDVWTPEVAPRVRRLRSASVRLSSLSDLLLASSQVPTLGVTGTAGKSTTTSFVVQLLRGAGLVAIASEHGYAGQRWATDELLPALEPRVEAAAAHTWAVLELTSSHLVFCNDSPTVAVITSFWPDHIELHGSLDAYRAAKERIVTAQERGDSVVVDADDPDVRRFADLTPATRWSFSATREVERGAFLRNGSIVARGPDVDTEVGRDPGLIGARRSAVLAAVAAALAAGVAPKALEGAADRLEAPPFRARVLGQRAGALVIDDGMAATPVKAAATLRAFPGGSVVLIAGGEVEMDGRALHSALPELALLRSALDDVARVARLTVVFGPAGERIAAELEDRGAPVLRSGGLVDGLDRALAHATGAAAVVFAPMFALTLSEREIAAARLAREI
jgi:UDP-N-acetylmuramoylalanine--D-glutamate ligase